MTTILCGWCGRFFPNVEQKKNHVEEVHDGVGQLDSTISD